MDIWQILRFNIAGLMGTGVHLSILWVAAFGLGWSLLLSNVTAFLVANIVSYFLHSRWTFRLRPQTRRRWYGASLVTLSIAGGMGHAADVLMPGSKIASLLIVVPVAITSYLLMRFWVFAPDQAAEVVPPNRV